MRWRSKGDRAAAIQVFPSVIDKVRSDGGQLTYAFENYTEVHTAFSVLATALEMSPQIVDVARDGIISAAVKELLGSGGPRDVEAFFAAAVNAEKAFLKQRPKDFVLLSRVSLRLPVQLRSVRRNGTRHNFSVRQPRGYDRPKSAVAQEASQLGDSAGYCWVRTSVSARDPAGAGEKGSELLDEWRSTWNYGLTYKRSRIWMGAGHAQPVNPIVVGPVHTLHHPDGSLAADYYWWEPAHIESTKLADVSEHRVRLARLDRKFANQIRRSKAGSQIARAFVRYVRAMDERDLHSAFLKLWGVLELVTDTGLQNYDVTIRRAGAVWRDPVHAKAILHHLRNRRNDLVHHGRESARAESLVYSLKTYIDELLGRLVGQALHLDSLSEFGGYLDLLADRKHLPRRARLVRLALRAH